MNQIRSGIKIFVVSLLILVMFSGCGYGGLTNYTDSGSTYDDMVRSGIVAEIGDYIFFRDFEDGGKLCSMKKNGRDYVEIMDTSFDSVVIFGDRAYFTAVYPDAAGLYSIKTDGTAKTKLADGDLHNVSISDGWVYYTSTTSLSEDDEKIELFMIKTDGSQNIKVFDGVACAEAKNGWIYYINSNDESKLYRMDLGGSGREMLLGDNVESFYVYKNYVYYTCITGSCTIYRANTDGTNVVRIADIPDSSSLLNVDDSWVYFNDGRRGIFKVGKDGGQVGIVGYTWDVAVKNWMAWGINSNEVGKVSIDEGGFIPLNKTLDNIVKREVPGYRMTVSYGSTINLQIEDSMTIKEVTDLKNNFGDLMYIYPSGLYYNGTIREARIVIGVRNTDEGYLSSIMRYLSISLNIKPQVIIFTVLEKDKLVSIDSIGYIKKDGMQLQRLKNCYYNSNDNALSKELTDKLMLWDVETANFSEEFVESLKNEGQYIYISGNYSGNENDKDSDNYSPMMYTGDIALYLPAKIGREMQMSLVQNITMDIETKSSSPWLNVALFYCEQGSGGMINRRILCTACKYPGDKAFTYIFNEE